MYLYRQVHVHWYIQCIYYFPFYTQLVTPEMGTRNIDPDTEMPVLRSLAQAILVDSSVCREAEWQSRHIRFPVS
jgi:hypothetical protein